MTDRVLVTLSTPHSTDASCLSLKTKCAAFPFFLTFLRNTFYLMSDFLLERVIKINLFNLKKKKNTTTTVFLLQGVRKLLFLLWIVTLNIYKCLKVCRMFSRVFSVSEKVDLPCKMVIQMTCSLIVTDSSRGTAFWNFPFVLFSSFHDATPRALWATNFVSQGQSHQLVIRRSVVQFPWSEWRSIFGQDMKPRLLPMCRGSLCERCMNVCMSYCKLLWTTASAKCHKMLMYACAFLPATLS